MDLFSRPMASLFLICATSCKVSVARFVSNRLVCSIYTRHGLPSTLPPYLPPRFIHLVLILNHITNQYSC